MSVQHTRQQTQPSSVICAVEAAAENAKRFAAQMSGMTMLDPCMCGVRHGPHEDVHKHVSSAWAGIAAGCRVDGSLVQRLNLTVQVVSRQRLQQRIRHGAVPRQRVHRAAPAHRHWQQSQSRHTGLTTTCTCWRRQACCFAIMYHHRACTVVIRRLLAKYAPAPRGARKVITCPCGALFVSAPSKTRPASFGC
jgi:hypothetical protein